ncbi:MAG: Unknown protein [uncultured Sulfurovum sp.]|uniref:Uncharacterized protein n=1 Tax=uncultured Sulfurovum sp. TaxID=269237 RepID=A0A6S6RVH5_9BACT|nr:MAG: Unknown protein [uncultured Sulfurovum sp.]
MFKKKVLAVIASLVAFTSLGMSATIIPATLSADFADGLTDIGTIIGLIFGVVVTLYVFKAVKSTFSK